MDKEQMKKLSLSTQRTISDVVRHCKIALNSLEQFANDELRFNGNNYVSKELKKIKAYYDSDMPSIRLTDLTSTEFTLFKMLKPIYVNENKDLSEYQLEQVVLEQIANIRKSAKE